MDWCLYCYLFECCPAAANPTAPCPCSGDEGYLFLGGPRGWKKVCGHELGYGQRGRACSLPPARRDMPKPRFD